MSKRNRLDALRKIVSTTGVPSRANNITDALYEIADYKDNPLTALEVDATINAETDLLGKYVTDLQEDIVIGERTITGTLKYVTGYTGFSGDTAEQEGNFICLHADVDNVTGVTIDAKLRRTFPVDPSDGLIVIRMDPKGAKTIQFIAHKEGYADVIREYDLSGLTLAKPAS